MIYCNACKKLKLYRERQDYDKVIVERNSVWMGWLLEWNIRVTLLYTHGWQY